MSYISKISEDDYDKKFTITNIDKSLANAIRRIMTNEIETFGFSDDDSSINILENTTKLHNEYLSHRISMIPLNISEDLLNFENYKFVINKNNIDNNLINITSKDFEVFTRKNDTSDWILDNDSKNRFFIKNPLSGDYILIGPLSPSNTTESEKISIECFPVKKNGKFNATFSPVCKSIFYNSLDPVKCAMILEKKLKDISNHDDREVQKKLFYNTEAYKYFKKNEKNEPFEFDFEVESIGVLKVNQIFQMSIEKLKKKIEKIKSNIVNNSVSFYLSEVVNYKAYDLKLTNEDHTLGNLIQSYVYKYFIDNDSELKYVGYDVPHPLEKNIIIRFAIHNQDYPDEKNIILIKEILFQTINNLVIVLDSLNKEWTDYKNKDNKVVIKKQK